MSYQRQAMVNLGLKIWSLQKKCYVTFLLHNGGQLIYDRCVLVSQDWYYTVIKIPQT